MYYFLERKKKSTSQQTVEKVYIYGYDEQACCTRIILIKIMNLQGTAIFAYIYIGMALLLCRLPALA